MRRSMPASRVLDHRQPQLPPISCWHPEAVSAACRLRLCSGHCEAVCWCAPASLAAPALRLQLSLSAWTAGETVANALKTTGKPPACLLPARCPEPSSTTSSMQGSTELPVSPRPASSWASRRQTISAASALLSTSSHTRARTQDHPVEEGVNTVKDSVSGTSSSTQDTLGSAQAKVLPACACWGGPLLTCRAKLRALPGGRCYWQALWQDVRRPRI